MSGALPGRAPPQPSKPKPGPRRTPRAEAEARLLAFAQRKGRGAFRASSRDQVARGAIDRVYDPNRIEQMASSLCGPAAMVRAVAATDPVAYADYIVQLFELGHGKLRRLEVEPDEDLRAYDPGVQINQADWIALASLRDSENWFFDYDEVDDPVAGITFPSSLAGWFRRAGYTSVYNETNLIIDKDLNNLRAANELYKRNYYVCLFINMKMLDEDEGEMTSGSFSADHWVVLSSRVNIVGSHVKLTVFTWGDGFRPVPPVGKSLTIDAFLDNYYGYVAAKY